MSKIADHEQDLSLREIRLVCEGFTPYRSSHELANQ